MTSDQMVANLDSRRLHTCYAHYIALGAHLEELDVRFKPYVVPAHDWPFHVVLRAPRLRKLHLVCHVDDEDNFPVAMERLAVENLPCLQLQELKFSSVFIKIEDFMAILHKFKQSLGALKLQTIRVVSGHDDLKQAFRALGDFLVLERIEISSMLSVLFGREHVHFPAVSARPIVDEPQGSTIRFEPNLFSEGTFRVEYSGPKMNAVLNILAETAELISV